jgi:hypothetical protein
LEGHATKKLRHWQFFHLVTSQFQRTLAPDTLLSISGEGGEAVDLLKDGQIATSAVNILKATKGFVMLGEDADDLLGGVVGGRNEATFNGVG